MSSERVARECSRVEQHMHSCGALTCQHDHSIGNIVLEASADRAVDLDLFRQWLANILWEEDEPLPWTIFRMKGVLRVQPDPDQPEKRPRFFLQAVQKLFEIEQGNDWNDDDIPCSKVILIGTLKVCHSDK